MFVQENLQNKRKQVVKAGRSEQQHCNSVTIIINVRYSVSCRSRTEESAGNCNDALLQTKWRLRYQWLAPGGAVPLRPSPPPAHLSSAHVRLNVSVICRPEPAALCRPALCCRVVALRLCSPRVFLLMWTCVRALRAASLLIPLMDLTGLNWVSCNLKLYCSLRGNPLFSPTPLLSEGGGRRSEVKGGCEARLRPAGSFAQGRVQQGASG